MVAELPIEQIIPELKHALSGSGHAVLVAEPGAGKTTRVPLALLDEPWLQGKRIVMLEPRRLAARAAAAYMSRSRGEKVGDTVGYRVRGDTRVGAATRIEVVTEGVLTRMLQSDPSLGGVGLVIFDEFHERSLQADLGLALSVQARTLFRDDLRLLVMSATLEAEPVAELLDDAPVLRSAGRSFPVETRYIPLHSGVPRVEQRMAAVIVQALREQPEGDVLAFLPGAGEIRRTEAHLANQLAGMKVRVAPLYGAMPQEAQDCALQPAEDGARKVVLATSIAETSLTVEGVRIVVDSGLMRVSRFSPRTGMTRLETAPVSKASADQRRGRAGRLGPGVCYRMWSEEEERLLPAYSKPEMLEADLSALALELAAWGVASPAELAWLTPPPQAAYDQARELLVLLGALDAAGAITAHGRRMAELAAAPRLAHMLLRAEALGLGALACELAALLGERDVLRGAPGGADADMRLRVEALRACAAGGAAASAAGVDTAAAGRIAAEAAAWRRQLGVAAGPGPAVEHCGAVLAFAYPDRIGQARGGGKFTLSGGRGAALTGDQRLARAPYLVAAELDDQGVESRIYLAAPIEQVELEAVMADSVTESFEASWDRDRQAVQARRRLRLGAWSLKEAVWDKPPSELIREALMAGIAAEGVGLLPWSKASAQLRQRIGFLHRFDAAWPDMSDDALVAALPEWLGPHTDGMRSRTDLQTLNLAAALQAWLTWEQRAKLDRDAPTHVTVPSGSRIPIDYSDPEQPALAVRLQEVFGWTETPRIAAGRLPLTLHLLSPAGRPVQVTRDLASFWRTAYFDVKKDLKGRYPKHHWPDDPLQAAPTNRAKPRHS